MSSGALLFEPPNKLSRTNKRGQVVENLVQHTAVHELKFMSWVSTSWCERGSFMNSGAVLYLSLPLISDRKKNIARERWGSGAGTESRQ